MLFLYLKSSFLIQIFSSFRFTAKLRRRYRDFSYIPCLPPCITSPIINIPHQSGTFITIDEPTLTHHNHSKTIVYIKVHSLCCTFYGFGQMYPSLWNHIEYFHCHKNLCSAHLSPTSSTPGNH